MQHDGTKARALVAVLNYNQVTTVIETLTCLAQMNGIEFDLILVDNASTNASVDLIRRALPGLHVLRRENNDGYAGGINFILDYGFTSGYDYVLACNNDIIVQPDTLCKMVAVASVHPDAAVIGGIEKCFFTNRIRTVGGTAFSRWSGRARWITAIDSDRTTSSLKYPFVQGALLLFTPAANHHNIRMDPRLFMYYEEPDLGISVANAGLSMYVAGSVIFLHKSEERFLDVKSGYYQHRNRLFMVRKHGKWYQVVALALYMLLFELPAKIVVRGVQGHGGFARTATLGVVDGLRGLHGRWEQHEQADQKYGKR